MSTLLKNLVIALCVTVVLGVVYYFTIGSSDEEFYEDVPAGEFDSEIAMRTEKILADTNKISEYALDVSIFSDRRFLSLKDFRIIFDDVSTGRENPFEPID
jgi:hypothetical protein